MSTPVTLSVTGVAGPRVFNSLTTDIPGADPRGGRTRHAPLLIFGRQKIFKIVSRSYVTLHINVYGLRKIDVSGSLIASSTLIVCCFSTTGAQTAPSPGLIPSGEGDTRCLCNILAILNEYFTNIKQAVILATYWYNMLHMSAQCYEHRFGYCTNA